MAHHRHYVRDRGMAGLGWIGHAGLGQDDGSDDFLGIPDYSASAPVDSSSGYPYGAPLSYTSDTSPGAVSLDDSLNPTMTPPIASSGTGQMYYGVDSKGGDVWVNPNGQFVNQDGLPISPAAGTLQVEGGGTVTVPAGAVSTSGISSGLKIASGALPALLAPGPAPRVTVPVAPTSLTSLLTGSSIIPGVSNLLILGGGLLAVVLLAGKK
jgi:hypothetical protein